MNPIFKQFQKVLIRVAFPPAKPMKRLPMPIFPTLPSNETINCQDRSDLSKAFHYLADSYLRGTPGFSQDNKKAVIYFEKAALFGNWKAAKTYLSLIEHQWLKGIILEEKKGPEILQAFTEQGNLEAMTKLALFKFKGIGTEKNKEEAISLLEKAIQKGHLPAKLHLKAIEKTL